jgi:hypothetical protein
MANKTPFPERLAAASRVLIDLDAIDEHRSLSFSAIGTVTAGRLILEDLLDLRGQESVPDRVQLDQVIARLQAKLEFLGQSFQSTKNERLG